jgi:hypothetical protein
MTVVNNNTTTLGEMVGQVFFLISENEGSSIFKRNEVIRALNAGLARISRKIDRNQTNIESLITTGDGRIFIPDGISQNGSVVIDNVYIDGTEIPAVNQSLDGGTTGTPAGYFIEGHDLVLAPAPDAEYTIVVRYRQEPAPLVEDADVTAAGDVAVEAAIQYACYMMKLKDEEYAAADRFKAEWDDMLREAATIQSGVYKSYSSANYGGAV